VAAAGGAGKYRRQTVTNRRQESSPPLPLGDDTLEIIEINPLFSVRKNRHHEFGVSVDREKNMLPYIWFFLVTILLNGPRRPILVGHPGGEVLSANSLPDAF
jgi:hypothetical protein